MSPATPITIPFATPFASAVAEIRAGSADPASLVRAGVARIRQENPRFNAIVAERGDQAVDEAAGLTSTGRTGGVLAGVPFTAKDMLATADLPTTCGSRALEGNTTGEDATVVARMRAAGAVLVGKTNCPEFALGVDTDNDLFGPTRNPLGPWTAGGSSGGEAAAVASGMSMVGLGSDYGGSLRWPAQCAGLVGLRPTVGRVPRSGEQPGGPVHDGPLRDFQDTVQVVGPIGRSAQDVFTVLQVIAGPDGRDPLAEDQPLRDYRDVGLEDLEIAWAPTVGEVVVDREVAAAVETAAAALALSGARVSMGVPTEVDRAATVYDRLRSAEPMSAVARLAEAHPHLVGAGIKAMLDARVRLTEDALAELWAERDALVAGLGAWLRGDRVLLLPVSTEAPHDLTGRVADFHLLAPSRAISLFGIPAVSVPVSTSSTGSPISVQVVGAAFREDVVLAVCDYLARGERAVSPAPEEVHRAR
ncbi:amidase [Pedococcus aerophilus]|uniref:Amidase n=1 Tax=Pedococcus aerophilus TaxID=436356 RepID=A0ABN3UFU7_9MICO